jgi:hypothetical protein
MKAFALITAVAAGAVFVALPLHSQAPGLPAGNPLEQLKVMRQVNMKLIEQQTATLQKLDEIAKDADQLKIFAKRS